MESHLLTEFKNLCGINERDVVLSFLLLLERNIWRVERPRLVLRCHILLCSSFILQLLGLGLLRSYRSEGCSSCICSNSGDWRQHSFSCLQGVRDGWSAVLIFLFRILFLFFDLSYEFVVEVDQVLAVVESLVAAAEHVHVYLLLNSQLGSDGRFAFLYSC